MNGLVSWRSALPLVVAVVVLAGCGGNSGSGDQDSTTLTSVQVNEALATAGLECDDKRVDGTDTDGTVTCQAGQQPYTVRILPSAEALAQELGSLCTATQAEEFQQGGPAAAQALGTAAGVNWFALSESALVSAQALAEALNGTPQTYAELCAGVGSPLWADVAPPQDPGEIKSAQDLKAALEARLGLRCGSPAVIAEQPPGFDREEITCSEGYVVIYPGISASSVRDRLWYQCGPGGNKRTDPFVLNDEVYLSWEGGDRGQRLIDALGGEQYNCKSFDGQ